MPAGVYSTTSVPASFHVTPASAQGCAGFHDSSFCTPSFVTRQTASSFTQEDAQKSAVAIRARSGESFGSAGRSWRRPFVRCRSTNDALPSSVMNSTTALISLTKSHSANVRPPWSASVSVNVATPVG